MRKLLTLLLCFCSLLCLAQNPTNIGIVDNEPDKGTGLHYFADSLDMVGFTPDTYDSEIAKLLDTQEYWNYNRDSLKWFPLIDAVQLSTIMAGNVTANNNLSTALISTDSPNALTTGTDGDLLVNMTTMTTGAPLTIGGNTYPVGTTLEDILNAMIVAAMADHLNSNQIQTNGDVKHITNGKHGYESQISGTSEFYIKAPPGHPFEYYFHLEGY